MSSEKGESQPCCSIPPVEADYTPKGTYTTLNGLKTYEIAPEGEAKAAVLFVYDIFGFAPQTVQAADLIASAGFKVFMPDFLDGNPATPDLFSGTEEANKRKAAYWSGFPAKVETQSKPVADAIAAIKSQGFTTVGAIGLCWGWKVIVKSEGVSGLAAVASNHPSFAAPDDADVLDVPVLLHPSKDEDLDVMQKIVDAVNAKKAGSALSKNFPDQPHGWSGARADLKDARGKEAYTQAWSGVVDFFRANL